MAKRNLREAPISYPEGSPERMDPRTERKFGSEESLYAKNPAFKKGVDDVERLASKRFQNVVSKARQAHQKETLGSHQDIRSLFIATASIVTEIQRLEAPHRKFLKDLALQTAIEKTGIGRDWFQYELYLGNESDEMMDMDDMGNTGDEERESPEPKFQMKPKERTPKRTTPDFEKYGEKAFDPDFPTEEEEFQQHVNMRNLVNAIVQGEAKKGHYYFESPNIKSQLDRKNPRLADYYSKLMTVLDLQYFTMQDLIDGAIETGQGVAGSVELRKANRIEGPQNDNDDDNDDEMDTNQSENEGPDTKIVAQGLIFPILVHEIIKGIEEAVSREQFSKTETGYRSEVYGQTDTFGNEIMQIQIGPEVVEALREALPLEALENQKLNPWFKKYLYQKSPKEFLNLMSLIISEKPEDNEKAKLEMKEILRDAMADFEDYEEYEREQEEKRKKSEDDELDDFLSF